MAAAKGPDVSRDEAFTRMVAQYQGAIGRMCFLYLRDRTAAEDALQEVLLKYLQKAPAFQSPGHEKAWLMTVCANQCRDLLRSRPLGNPRHPLTPNAHKKARRQQPPGFL